MATRARSPGFLAAALLALSAQATPSSSPLRFQGLERVYFERVEAPEALPGMPPDIAETLPATWDRPGARAAGISVRDFDVPVRDRPLRIREVAEFRHPRVARIWWALYDTGRRTDVWTFTPAPERTDGKLLTNYRLHGLAVPSHDTIVLRVRGEMLRPSGAWSLVAREWELHVGAAGIALVRVRNPFGLFRGYVTGDVRPAVTAHTERDVDGRIEIRSLDDVPEHRLSACGLRDPLVDDERVFDWGNLLETARCLTEAPDATVRHRDASAPTFGERAHLERPLPGRR